MEDCDLLRDNGFMMAQYGHLKKEEWPTKGPVIDVTAATSENRSNVEKLDEKIRAKKRATMDWVEKRFPGKTAIFLTRPFFWQNNASPQLQELAAKWMAQIITEVYGDGYPLPNKHWENNFAEIKNGTLLPYFGCIGDPPIDIIEGCVREVSPYNLLQGHYVVTKSIGHTELMYDERESPPITDYARQLIPVATSALILNNDGFAELGRNANRGYKNPTYTGFEGGPTTLERVYDWLRNRHRLLERVHTLTSDMRAATAHGESPSSLGVQTLLLRDLGMRIRLAAPLYDVNGIEPFLSVIRPRNLRKWQETNRGVVVFTPSPIEGSLDHTSFLRKLWQHQLGLDLYLQVVNEEVLSEGYNLALAKYYSPEIYGLVDIYDQEKLERLSSEERKRITSLDNAIDELDRIVPTIIVKIEAESPISAATQSYLMKRGFVVCGIEPRYNEEYLNGKEQLTIRKYQSPVYIYMARLGAPLRLGTKKLVEAEFVDPKVMGMVNGFDEELRRMLYEVQKKISEGV